jgi:hypothetical protein
MSAWLVLAYYLDPGRIVRPSEVKGVHIESGNLIKQ